MYCRNEREKILRELEDLRQEEWRLLNSPNAGVLRNISHLFRMIARFFKE